MLTFEPTWLTIARGYLGCKEIPGPRHESRIVRMWEAIRAPFRDDETPWCAAFVGACLEEAGFESTRRADARSYLRWGVPTPRPWLGCIVVFSRPGSAWSGHVGFVVGRNGDSNILHVLGGNQGDCVSVAPFSAARVLGYRMPGSPEFYWPVPVMVAAGPVSTDEA